MAICFHPHVSNIITLLCKMEKLYFIQKQVIQPMANFIVIEYSMKLQTWRGLYEISNANNASSFFTNWYRRRFIFAKIMHLWKSEPNIMSWNCLPFNHLIPNTHNYALPRFCKQKICFLSNKNECLPIHMSMMYYIRLSNIDRNESVSCFTFWPQLSFYKDRHAFTVSWQKCCRFSILMLHLKWNLNWKCRECHMLT